MIVLHLLYQLRIHCYALVLLHVLDLELPLDFEFKCLHQIVVQDGWSLLCISFLPTGFVELGLVLVQLVDDLLLDIVEVQALGSLWVLGDLYLDCLFLQLDVDYYQDVQGSVGLLCHVLHVGLNALDDLVEVWEWCERQQTLQHLLSCVCSACWLLLRV